jgi:5-methylcytosine-specific restriction endonuclease McrA
LPPRECPGCHEIYPRTPEFWSHNKKHKDGLQSRCRLCRCRAAIIYRNANLEAERERVRLYQKAHPDKARACARLYRETNREKLREYARLYYKANIEKVRERSEADRNKRREYMRLYQKAHSDKICEIEQRRRARLRDLPHDLTESQYAETLAYFNHACAYCGVPQSELSYKLHREHILPSIRGGGYTRDNIVPACAKCNLPKHDKTPEEAGMNLLKPWPPENLSGDL